MNKKILFIVPHRLNRSPGQRFRFEQYLQYLQECGFSYTYSYLINEKDDRIFYSPGNIFKKSLIMIKSIFIRLKDVWRAKNYDIIFIYREAVFFGSALFERLFKLSGKPIVFDYDDAIWLMDVSDNNRAFRWIKRPSKVATIIKKSSIIFAGNAYLADYAKKHNQNVAVIPTTIDTDYYKRVAIKKAENTICIGWTGSATTLKHFELAIPFLKIIKHKYPQVIIHLISDVPFITDELEIVFIKWNRTQEVADLCYFDIGIMPLPNDAWAKGKCGFKGLQYMALEIPAIMSPVGVNTEIIKHGENGFLADTVSEWITYLSLLIEDKNLRDKLGKAGRKTIEDTYSFHSQKNRYLQLLQNL